jgi:hypothetical protein
MMTLEGRFGRVGRWLVSRTARQRSIGFVVLVGYFSADIFRIWAGSYDSQAAKLPICQAANQRICRFRLPPSADSNCRAEWAVPRAQKKKAFKSGTNTKLITKRGLYVQYIDITGLKVFSTVIICL